MRPPLLIACLLCACYLDTATRLSLSRPASPSVSPACLEQAVASVPGIRVVRRSYATRRAGAFLEVASVNTGSGYVEIMPDTTRGASLVILEYSWFGAVPELGEQQAATRASREILEAVREACTPDVDAAITCSLLIGARQRACPVL